MDNAGTGLRRISLTTAGMPATEGAGVNLTRLIGTPQIDHIDPFLLFDVFETDNPDDYIAGFPPHPHRGFETVTYMLAGQMRHKDNAGNEGVIRSGGVQWMTAGRGIVHSEMPEQQNGMMWGTQLWVNLPSEQKMTAPGYQEFDASAIPEETLHNGGIVRIIAGTTSTGKRGAVNGRAVDARYFDVSLPANALFREVIPASHQVFIFVIEGTLSICDEVVSDREMAILGSGSELEVVSRNLGARFLLIAGRQLNEPIARGGPFVMNTREEVRQAFDDYRSGRF
jgi:redox-sensitive bicupin YhaK (pirin superfamily)